MASRERDDAMAGLLKRTLAGNAGARNDCPGPDVLAAYFERSLDADETAHVEMHLSECPRCRELVAALGRAEAEAPAASAAAPAAGAPRKAPRASWIWDWRWLAPVAAVLVIAAVWATRRPDLTRIAEHPEEAPATAPTSPPAQPPIQNADQKAVQPEKQQPSSRLMAPVPSTAPATRQASPATGSGTRFRMGAPAATAENSRATHAAPPKPASPDELSKKAEQQESSADTATNAPSPTTTSESVTVESETQAVAGAAIGPSPAPAPPPSIGGVIGGASGAAIGASSAKVQTSKEKAPSLVSTFRARNEIVSANQAGELSSAHIIPTPDVKILWRIASGGFIERSENAGATWSGTLPSPNAHFEAGSAPSAKVCWLVGDDGIILLTRDAVNWQTIPPPARQDLVAVSARNRSSATVTTADGRKFTTTNQGESWTPAK